MDIFSLTFANSKSVKKGSLYKIQEENELLRNENNLLKEQIKLYPESNYILENVKSHFDGLK